MPATPFPVAPVDDRVFQDLRASAMASTALALARDIGLFDLLADAPRTIDDTASAYDVTERAAEALLATVAATGMARVTSRGQYEPTDVARTYLLTDGPFEPTTSLSADADLVGRLTTAFESKDGPPEPFAVVMGELTDEEVRRFIGHMHTGTLAAAGGLGALPMFASIRSLLDVAGGSGSLCCGVASQHERIQCTILDLEPVCRIADENIATYGLSERVRTHVADMFHDEWPRGHDALLFGNIFHDWDPEACRELARRSFDALESGGRILLHEMLLDETKDGPLAVACMSLTMLMHEKGKQFTPGELRDLLGDVGFVEFDVTHSFGYYSVVSAVKP